MNFLHTFSPALRRLLALFFALLVVTALWAEATQAQLSQNLIRLHVLANSDSQADQALKLHVRDKVLAQTNRLLEGQTSLEGAAAVLRQNLDVLAQTAAGELRARGSSDPVSVRLETTWFPTRQYEGISLPAGNYQALRVIIGEGAGKNWWCLLFPALTLPAVSETQAPAAALPAGELALISEESPAYAFRFKTVEWWETFKHSLSRQD